MPFQLESGRLILEEKEFKEGASGQKVKEEVREVVDWQEVMEYSTRGSALPRRLEEEDPKCVRL